MKFIDRPLAHRLELTDAYGSVAFARAHAGRFPEAGSTAEPFAGGWAIFAGVDSPLTQAFALGLLGPVEEGEVARMEDFFRSRDAATMVELCPYADLSIVEVFGRRGYTAVEFTNVLARRLTPIDTESSFEGAVRVRQTEAREADAWAEAVARGFIGEGEPSPMMIELFSTSLASRAGAYFLAEIDGQIAGGGMVTVHDGVASLGGASTLPAFRNRGAQSALLRARLTYAAEQGCEIAMVTTLPGSTSQRNVERQGFRVVYTRTKLQRSEVRGQGSVAGV